MSDSASPLPSSATATRAGYKKRVWQLASDVILKLDVSMQVHRPVGRVLWRPVHPQVAGGEHAHAHTHTSYASTHACARTRAHTLARTLVAQAFFDGKRAKISQQSCTHPQTKTHMHSYRYTGTHTIYQSVKVMWTYLSKMTR